MTHRIRFVALVESNIFVPASLGLNFESYETIVAKALNGLVLEIIRTSVLRQGHRVFSYVQHLGAPRESCRGLFECSSKNTLPIADTVLVSGSSNDR